MDETQRQYHDVANIFPLMTGSDFEALKADIAANGLLEPIWLHPDGRIIDGRNRHRACVELGIAPEFRTWGGDGSLVTFVVSLNLHRRHLTESQRAMIAARLATMTEGRPEKTASIDAVSQTEAGQLLNVSRRAVQRAHSVQSTGSPELVSAVDRGDVAVSAAAQVATLPAEWQRVIVEHDEVKEVAAELRQGRNEAVEERVKPHVAHNSGNNEWYTPAEYIEAARRVMGRIDLDPASSAVANDVVRAKTFYTVDDDGLLQEWRGKVWMNPPYSGDVIGRFADKIACHYDAGDIDEAIVLVNNATETAWFQRMARSAECICFPRSRIRFWSPNGTPGAPLQGQALIYLGGYGPKFRAAFSSFGIVVTL